MQRLIVVLAALVIVCGITVFSAHAAPLTKNHIEQITIQHTGVSLGDTYLY